MQKIKNLIKIILSYIYFPVLAIFAKHKIKIFLKKERTIDENIEWVNKFKVGPNIKGLNINFTPLQVDYEIKSLLEIINKESPKIILEIGTASGGTIFLFIQIASNNTEFISIDMPFGKFGGGYLRSHIPLFKLFVNNKQNLHLIRGDSQNQETLNKLSEILQHKKIDFLFIDGDHTYEGVKSDFNLYKNFVKPGGIIAFHDIQTPGIGVNKFWNEIKNNFTYNEFVAFNSTYGIGILKIS